jgi:hypothetical protein
LGLSAYSLKASQARYLAANLFASVFMEAMIKETILARNALCYIGEEWEFVVLVSGRETYVHLGTYHSFKQERYL